MRKLITFSILTIAFIFSWNVRATTKGSMIRVKPHVVLTDSKDIFLGDLLEFQNISAKLKTRLTPIKMGDAPKKGEKRVYSSRAISSVLRKQLDKGRSDIQLIVPQRVVVSNPRYTITDSEVRKALTKGWSGLCSECLFNIRRVELPLLPKNLNILSWQLGLAGNIPKGSFSIPLRIEMPNSEQKTLWVSGEARVHRKVPVATRMLYFGDRIQKEDMIIKEMDVTFSMKGVPEAEQVIGKQVKRSLRSNEIIWRDDLLREKALKRGDLVKVTSGSQEWSISINAIAEEDGYIGDIVKVRNPSSDKLMSGKVIDKSILEIL